MCHDRGLFPAFMIIAVAVDAMTVQIRLNPINKGQIGVATNRGNATNFSKISIGVSFVAILISAIRC